MLHPDAYDAGSQKAGRRFFFLDLVYFLAQFKTMIRLNIHEAKTHLSKYLPRLEQGEKIMLCRRNVPIAEIVPITRSVNGPRPIGLAKGAFSVSPDFFAPLPDEIQKAFEGSNG